MIACIILALCIQEDAEKLVNQLGADSYEAQGKAAKALESMGPNAVPALEKAAQSSNAQVAVWARKILERIREEERRRAEEAARQDQELAAAERKKIQNLVFRLADKDFESQGNAAEKLKQIGAAAIPLLKAEVRSNPSGQAAVWAVRILHDLEAVPLAGEVQKDGAFATRFALRKGSASEKALAAALGWLARHPSELGFWNSRSACGACPDAGSDDFNIGVSALALLAFLGSGHTHLSTEYGATLARGIRWLVYLQANDGSIAFDRQRWMYGHAIATAALCEAYGMTGSPALREPAQKAVDFLLWARNPKKGWRYTDRSPDNDVSVTAWCILAVKSALVAGLKVDVAFWTSTRTWLDEVTDSSTGRTGYTSSQNGKVYVPGVNEAFEDHPTLSAASIILRLAMGAKKSEISSATFGLVCGDVPEWKPFKVDLCYWYYGGAAMYHMEGAAGKHSKKWLDAMHSALVAAQKKDGCLAGSWPPEEDRWSREGGRVAATALAALALETTYRYPRFSK
jgi:hypothetical protein